ncbi:MAG: hypothetical protein ACJAYU_001615 [Bradymonadia bacterium]|jgi:hypothetical protein
MDASMSCPDATTTCPVEEFSPPLRWHPLSLESLGVGGAWDSMEWRVLETPRNSTGAIIEELGLDTARAWFDVSGNYRIGVEFATGNSHYCEWTVHVGGPGLNVEMMWDTDDSVDMDLHLHQPGSNTDFCSDDDCYYAKCRASRLLPGTDSGGDGCHDDLGCSNPRLEPENTSGLAAENINHDNPPDGATFRIMAQMFSGTLTTNPVVTVYCGGVARAVMGEAPDGTALARSGSGCGGQSWRVADVTMHVDPYSGATECTVGVLYGEDGE